MIKLERVRTSQAINAGLRGAKRLDKLMLLLRGTRDSNLKFTSANSHWKLAKVQLKAEAHGKCAYCEANTDVVAHGDVEHYRPKSKYWWLAYCYDNFLFACQICNQIYKKDEFPVHGAPFQLDPPFPASFAPEVTEAELRALAAQFAPDPLTDSEGQPMAKFLAASRKEKAGLPDPYQLDPEPLFKWVADPVNKEVTLKARNSTVASKRALAACEQFLGLNREELRRVRWETYRKLEIFKKTFEANQLDDALRADIQAVLQEMMANQAPFAGMVRYFVREVWRLNLN
jgi:uncharacterized protein (TIGR02646 family)